MGVGHDAADDSAAVRGDGIESEADSSRACCGFIWPPFPHILLHRYPSVDPISLRRQLYRELT